MKKPQLKSKRSTSQPQKMSAKQWNIRRVTSKDTLLGSATIRSTSRQTLLVKNITFCKDSTQITEVAHLALLEMLLAQSYWDTMQGQIEFIDTRIPPFISMYASSNTIDLECPEEAVLTPRDTKLLYLTLMGFSSEVKEALMAFDIANQINVEDICFLLSKRTYSLLELEMLILSGFRPDTVIYGQLDFSDISSLLALQAASYGMFVQKFIESLSVKVSQDPNGQIRSYEEPFWDVTSRFDAEHNIVYCYHSEEPFPTQPLQGNWHSDTVLLIKPLFVAAQSKMSELLDQTVTDARNAAAKLQRTLPKDRFSTIQPLIIVPMDTPDTFIGMRDGIPILRVPLWEREVSAQALARSFAGPICLRSSSSGTPNIDGLVLVEFFGNTQTELSQRVEEHIVKFNHPAMQSEHIPQQAGFTLRFAEAYKLEAPMGDSLLVDASAITILSDLCRQDAELKAFMAFGVIPQRLMSKLVTILRHTRCEEDMIKLAQMITRNADKGFVVKPILSLKKPRNLWLQNIGMGAKRQAIAITDFDTFETLLPGETRIPRDISPAEQFSQLVELALKLNRPTPVRVPHIPLTETLRRYAYGEIAGENNLQFIFGDKGRSTSKPIPRRTGTASLNPQWNEWYPIRLGCVGIRHMELDGVVHLYICSNRTVSNPRNSSATIEEYAYNSFMQVILQDVPKDGIIEPIKVELYHTGLEPVIIGIYRAVIDLLNAGQKMVVVPMLHPTNDSYQQGELWF